MAEVPTPAEISDLLVTLLEGAAGGTAAHWRKAIGEVEAHPLWSHIRSNWDIHPKGRKADLDAIEKAAEIVRQAHPYVVSRASG